MKFTSFHSRHAGLLLACCVMVSACNKEEFFKAEEFLVGNDAFCFQEGPDLNSCHALGDQCRAAYIDADDGSQNPEFAMCISNPNYDPNAGTDGSSSGGSTDGGSTDGGSTDGGSTDGGSTDGGATDGGSTAGGSTDGGSSTGGTDGGSSAGGSTGGSGSTDPEVPTIEEAYDAKCENLPAKYMWVKKEVTKKGTKVTSKVKVCHHTGNNSSHTILIACQALKPHIKHHEDYVGVCEE